MTTAYFQCLLFLGRKTLWKLFRLLPAHNMSWFASRTTAPCHPAINQSPYLVRKGLQVPGTKGTDSLWFGVNQDFAGRRKMAHSQDNTTVVQRDLPCHDTNEETKLLRGPSPQSVCLLELTPNLGHVGQEKATIDGTSRMISWDIVSLTFSIPVHTSESNLWDICGQYVKITIEI